MTSNHDRPRIPYKRGSSAAAKCRLATAEEYKETIEFAYFCNYEPEGRDKSFNKLFQNYATVDDYLEIDPSTLEDFGKRNVFIVLPGLFRKDCNPSGAGEEGITVTPVVADGISPGTVVEASNGLDSAVIDAGAEEPSPTTSSSSWSTSAEWEEQYLVYVFAHDPWALQDRNGRFPNQNRRIAQLSRLEDIIVCVTPSTIIPDDFFTSMYNDFKHCYDDSALDAWGYEYPPEEISETIKSRVVTQITKHLKEKYGDPANTEEFFKNWFSVAKGSETFEQMMSASTFRGMPSWQEQAQRVIGSDEDWSDEDDPVSVHASPSDRRFRPESYHGIDAVQDSSGRVRNGPVLPEDTSYMDRLMAQWAEPDSPVVDTVEGQEVSPEIARALVELDDLRERLTNGTMPFEEIEELMAQIAGTILEGEADLEDA